tara:strand:- start:4410 stop:5513 length:1104 start_codon:yes stop_codon:yes gene_type:complete
MAPLCHALEKNSDFFNTTICVTGQHREMLDQVLNIFSISPHVDLSIMKKGQDLTDITSSILLKMRDVISQYKPDLILVHGDTTTTIATSMAAFYAKIQVAHIEAGLRTYDMSAPFPEEFNRQITSKISNWHFAPTKLSKMNLINEGVENESIEITGNTVIDALFWVIERLEHDSDRRNSVVAFISNKLNFDWINSKYILITGHRRENFGEGFINICEAISNLAAKYKDINFVYPVHLNPNVQDPVNLLLSKHSNIYLIEPLEYEPFLYLLKHSYLVLTDSGGIQEEAPSLGKPVLVMRDVTERPEAVEAGTVKLVGANKDKIIKEVSELIDSSEKYKNMSLAHNPYGDGKASVKIVNFLKKVFHEKL